MTTSNLKPGTSVTLIDAAGKQSTSKISAFIAKGGAGSIYALENDTNHVLKIYHNMENPQALKEYENRISSMMAFSPDLDSISSNNKHYVQIAWPNALAYYNKSFIGFTMPILDLDHTANLELAINPRQAKESGLPSDMGARVTLARQLSSVVAALHEKDHYIVDLKPQNLNFYKDTLYMAILDCDGFSIHQQSGRLHAPQFTLDYLAPEFQPPNGKNPNSDPAAQDKFALAVVIFKLLNYGIHPYQGKQKASSHTQEGCIAHRLYPYGLMAHANIAPNPMSTHECFPQDLRNLFDRAFTSQPSIRPTAQVWRDMLTPYATPSTGKIIQCQQDRSHRHFAGLPCGECRREQLTSHAPKKASPISNQKSSRNQPIASGSLIATNTSISPLKYLNNSPWKSMCLLVLLAGVGAQYDKYQMHSKKKPVVMVQQTPTSNNTAPKQSLSTSTPTTSYQPQNSSQATTSSIPKFTSNDLLGLEISLITDDEDSDIKRVIITKVKPNSIAMLYGIQEGDWLITANGADLIGGTKSDYLDKLPKIINIMENSVTENAVKRNGNIVSIYLPNTIPEGYDPRSPVLPRNASVGIKIKKQIGANFEKSAGKISVGDREIGGTIYKITEITKNSPAYNSGKIHVGDFFNTYIGKKFDLADYAMNDKWSPENWAGYAMREEWSAEYVENSILQGPQDSWLTLGLIDKDSGRKKVVSLQRKSQAQISAETASAKKPKKKVSTKGAESSSLPTTNADSSQSDSLDYDAMLLYRSAVSCLNEKNYTCAIIKAEHILERYPYNAESMNLKIEAELAAQNNNTQPSTAQP